MKACSPTGFFFKKVEETHRMSLFRLLLVVAFHLSCAERAQFSHPSFEDWTNSVGKQYRSPEEHAHRRSIFDTNTRRIEEHNRREGHSYTLGHTVFADLSPAEFESGFLTGLRRPHLRRRSRRLIIDAASAATGATGSKSAAATHTRSASRSGSVTKTLSGTPSGTLTRTVTSTHTVTVTVTPSSTTSSTASDSTTMTSSVTGTASTTVTSTVSITMTTTRSITLTTTASLMVTASPSDAVSLTLSASSSESHTAYVTSTISDSSSETPSDSASPSYTPSPVLSFDWRAMGQYSPITPVGFQGACGSCWAFTAAGAMEARAAIVKGMTQQPVPLSKQQLVDCSGPQGNAGCGGGWMNPAFEFALDGVCSEASYPYVGVDQTCATSCTPIVYTTGNGFIPVPSNDDGAVQDATVGTGPVVVAVEASLDLQLYTGGVMNGDCGTGLNHALLVIGFGVDSVSSSPYWTAKNSWGIWWGENGFVRLLRDPNVNNGAGQCGMLLDPSLPDLLAT